MDNVAIGPQGQLYATGFGAYGNDLRNFAQWDDTNWIALGSGFQTASNALALDSPGHLYAQIPKDSEQGLTTAMIRWDGARWEDITGNFSIAVDALKTGRVSSNIPGMALAVDGEDNLYAAGSFYYPNADHTAELPMGYVAKWDKETWTVLGQGFDKVNIYALAVSSSGQVYVSGEQPGTGFIAQWDGETWTPIGTSKLSSCLSIKSLAVDKTGGLYASCTWSEAGELIFYWDGTDWITISDQLQGEAPAIFDMAVDANGHLYIGGSFESVSGIPAQNIAYWDGSLWHALGTGVNQPVNALAVAPSGELFAVGAFTRAGDLPVHYVVRWDGKTWHALGP
jgi:trimeric autotransporter adhesin